MKSSVVKYVAENPVKYLSERQIFNALILLPIGKVCSGITGKTYRGITGKLFRNTGKACSEFLVKYEIGIVVNYRVEYAQSRRTFSILIYPLTFGVIKYTNHMLRVG